MKKSKFSRTTITVPTVLKKKMDKVQTVNWSAAACRAFEQELDKIEGNKKILRQQAEEVLKLINDANYLAAIIVLDILRPLWEKKGFKKYYSLMVLLETRQATDDLVQLYGESNPRHVTRK